MPGTKLTEVLEISNIYLMRMCNYEKKNYVSFTWIFCKL